MKVSKAYLFKIGITANILEWYDFCISAFMAIVLGKVFFGADSEIDALILSFSAFLISYLIRPFGGVFFGFIGDKYGTIKALKISLLLMSIPTMLIGVLPSYHQIGCISSCLFILSKLLQGFAAGGELPITAIYMYQITQNKQYKLFYCSFIQTGSTMGLLLASLLILSIYLVYDVTAIQVWAWRIPFLISIPLTLFIVYIRSGIINNFEATTINKGSLFKKDNLILLSKSLLISSFVSIYSCILFIWMPSYLEVFLHISFQSAKILNLIALFFLAISTLFFGYVYTFINYKKILLVSSILLIIVCFFLFDILSVKSLYCLISIHIIFGILMGAIQGCFMFTLNSIFSKSSIVNIGVCLSYTLPTAIIAGSAPLICGFGVIFFNNLNFPGLYISVFGIIAIPLLYSLLKIAPDKTPVT